MGRVDGFVVLRLPEFNFVQEGVGAARQPPSIGELHYSGIDRMRWNEIDRDFYAESLPHNLVAIRKEIWERSPANSDIKLCADLEIAIGLLEYSNREAVQNELAVARSAAFTRHPTVALDDARILWLGTDLYCHGYGSQILGGLFAQPDAFPEFVGEVNQYGLFDQESPAIRMYRDAYLSRAVEVGLEPMGDAVDNLDMIDVGRVLI